MFLDKAGSPWDRDSTLAASRFTHPVASPSRAVDCGCGRARRPVRAQVTWLNLKRSGQLASLLADVPVECGVVSFVVVLETNELIAGYAEEIEAETNMRFR